MSQISITGASTGTATFTIESPATSTNRTLTLPDNTGTIITQNSTPAFASTIGVGGATAAASGAGITFPATQSASSDANTLDDYEEGTFTPTLTSGGTGITYANQKGAYTKIGRLVTFQIALDLSAVTPAAGQITIGGLPFTSSANTLGFGGAFVNYNNSFNTNAGDTYHVNAGDTVITVYTNGGLARLGNGSGISLLGDILLTGQYIAA
jgi:hypothetical protein